MKDLYSVQINLNRLVINESESNDEEVVMDEVSDLQEKNFDILFKTKEQLVSFIENLKVLTESSNGNIIYNDNSNVLVESKYLNYAIN